MNSKQVKTMIYRYVGWDSGHSLNEHGVIQQRLVRSHSPYEAVVGALVRLVKEAYQRGHDDAMQGFRKVEP